MKRNKVWRAYWKTLKKIYFRDLDTDRMIPLSELVDCAIVFTPEDLEGDFEFPKSFTIGFGPRIYTKRNLWGKIKYFLRTFKKWEGKLDKKTATFDKLYIGHDRRRKSRDVIIEYLKVNGIDYTPEGDEIDNAVHQHIRDMEDKR